MKIENHNVKNSKTDNRKVISMQSEDEHVNSCLDH